MCRMTEEEVGEKASKSNRKEGMHGWWRQLYRAFVWGEVLRLGAMVLEPTDCIVCWGAQMGCSGTACIQPDQSLDSMVSACAEAL